MRVPPNRIEWLDMAKGYGIVLVIIGHCNFPEYITMFIYAFHMPLFFFLSGYVFNLKDNFSSFLHSKTKRMLIPYFCLSIPIIFADLYFKKGFCFGWEDVMENAECFFVQSRHTTLWFLSCLIVINIIMYLIIQNVKYLKIKIGITMILCLSGISLWRMGIYSLPWNFDAALIVSPFFYIGYEMRGGEFHDRIVRTIGLPLILMIVSFLGVGVYLLNQLNCNMCSGMRFDIYCSNINNEGLSYFVAALGVEMMVLLSMCKKNSIITYVGRNSLMFFAWHQSIVLPSLQRLYSKIGIGNYVETIPVKCITVVLILCVITILNEIIVRSRIKFIIGK